MKSPSFRTVRLWALVLVLIPLAFDDSSRAVGQSLKPQSVALPQPLQMKVDDRWVIDSKTEASALELIDERQDLLLIADDKTPEPRIVELETGRIVHVLKSSVLPPPSQFGPKWEGSAKDSQGWIYLVGSHSGATDAERRERERLIRFRVARTAGGGFAIEETSARRWSIAESLVSALRGEGLKDDQIAKRKVEGLAVREAKKELAVGLREPDDRVRVYAIDISAPPENGASLKLTKLFEFDPGENEGVRFTLNSLHHSAKLNAFLILTATEDASNVYHGNALWRIPDSQLSAGGGAVQPERLWMFETAMKAEGLCELPGGAAGEAKIAIVYDNDAAKTKIPSRLTTVTLAP